MKRFVSEDEIKCAELIISRFFDLYGKTARVQHIVQYAKDCGICRAELKEARKRLGLKSEKGPDGQCWTWPEGSNPGKVNEELSREIWEDAGKRD